MRQRYSTTSYLNQQQRDQIVSGYADTLRDYVSGGAEPYYINFMFNHIRGGLEHRREVMKSEVTRVHYILTRHIVRRPEAPAWRHLRPVFLGCFDTPVWKHEKTTSFRDVLVNDGLHYNAIALLPPPARAGVNKKYQQIVSGRQSRLEVPLDEHLKASGRFYASELLARIHVTPVTYGINGGNMMDYTLKAFKHGKVDSDSIEIWN